MKIIAIGDTHGRNDWEEIVKKEPADKYVFVGDYFDSYDIGSPEQLLNFDRLIEFKKQNMDKVVLLFGNHDYHYLWAVSENYSGFKAYMKPEVAKRLDESIERDLLKMCFVYNEYLFCHAGVTKTWCDNNNIKVGDIENELNYYLKFRPKIFGFSGYDMYGDDITQSPIWVRPKSLLADMIPGYTQIVGHTRVKKIELDHEIILIDTIEDGGQYLIIDNEITIGSVK